MSEGAKTSAVHQNHSSSQATTPKEQKLMPLKGHAFSFAEITKRGNFFPKKLPCIQVPSLYAKYAHMATEKTFVAFDS